MAYDFQQLRVWQVGEKLLLEIYSVSKSFSKHELYALTSHLRRCANSIIANIAEAHGRYFKKDKIRILYIARGEIEEIKSHLIVAKDLRYCKQETVEQLLSQYSELSKQINSLITSISNN